MAGVTRASKEEVLGGEEEGEEGGGGRKGGEGEGKDVTMAGQTNKER